jgi:hypothetical protein
MPGAANTQLIGIDGGNIVGSYETNSGDCYYHGFLYNGTNWITLDMPGASTTMAFDIDGSTIVGWYTDNSSGNYHPQHGFLYVPEPSTLTLLALGGLWLIGVVWQRQKR